MFVNEECMRLRQVARKLQAVAALIGLLVATVPLLAESLSASSLPACCNTVYCPVHHHQAHQLQADKSICDSQGSFAGNDCAMRACDTAPNPAVGTLPFVLTAPLAMRGPAIAEPARVQAPRFFPLVVSIPLTPPPRTLPS
jgi:hypothetical protein